jgi:hypothetical protein
MYMLPTPGMTDMANFIVFDKNTIKRNSLPTPNSPIYSAGLNSDTVSKINPKPGPTNSTYTMSAEMLSDYVRPTRKVSRAEWKRPTYNYTRTKSAEADESPESSNTIYASIVGTLFVLGGGFLLLKSIDTDWDIPAMGGATP